MKHLRLVIEVRTIIHPQRPYAFIAPPDPRKPTARRRRPKLDDYGGVGTQIVREQALCPACAAQTIQARRLEPPKAHAQPTGRRQATALVT